MVHLGSRAIGGAGLIIAEASGVEPRGRITLGCTGIWSEAHVAAWQGIVAFAHAHGAVLGIQLAHAGRKASSCRPWEGAGSLTPAQGAHETIAPSAIAFSPSYTAPRAMSLDDIGEVQMAFRRATSNAVAAGFRVIEIHAAHGYLMHSFLSPLSNHRTDAYGGAFENRVRMLIETVRHVRSAMPDNLPLFVRLSCSDWVEGGWSLEESIVLAGLLKTEGVDVIDCSSGGTSPTAKVPATPGYQVPFAAAIRREAGIATAAVGLITEAEQANDIIANGQADVVLMARAMLRDPYWALHAAKSLGKTLNPPLQYARAF
jgi:2,4-dienoyl-CoA reductase-like NADH-dependent reductase (Old Yellow Enzyme family)